MYLSQIAIGWNWAKEPYQLHRALWQLFPDRPEDQRDFLFRVERDYHKRGVSLLLQSVHPPHQVPVAKVLASKALDLSLKDGQRLHFKLRANPVKNIKDENGRLNAKGEVKTCRVPLVSESACLHWLKRKFGEAASVESAQVTSEPALMFNKKGMIGKIQPVMYEGTLLVDSSDEFSTLVRQGIGPAKSMGCGLLSLARV